MAREHAEVQQPMPASRSLAPARTATPRGTPRRWPWLVAALTVTVFVAANLVYPADDADPTFTLMFSSIAVAFTVVGALLTVRVPDNPIGPMILWSAALQTTTIAIGTWAVIGQRAGDVPLELLALGVIANELGFTLPIIVVLVLIPLIFPDGRLLSPAWRWAVVLAVGALAASTVSQLLGPSPLGSGELPNPFHVPALDGVTSLLGGFANWSSAVCFGSALLAVVIRYQRGDVIRRQQLKWLIAVAAVAAIAFPVAFIAPGPPVANVAFVIGMLSLLAFPIAIAIAVLRYRLYDIHRIISRTIGWAIISGVLAAAFVALVVGLQALFAGQTQGQTLAVAASTLAAFALFQPVRRRVQRAVDRRFDRARYDAQRTADAFTERLRDEVELQALTHELQRVVVASMRPSSASIWLPGRDRRAS